MAKRVWYSLFLIPLLLLLTSCWGDIKETPEEKVPFLFELSNDTIADTLFPAIDTVPVGDTISLYAVDFEETALDSFELLVLNDSDTVLTALIDITSDSIVPTNMIGNYLVAEAGTYIVAVTAVPLASNFTKHSKTFKIYAGTIPTIVKDTLIPDTITLSLGTSDTLSVLLESEVGCTFKWYKNEMLLKEDTLPSLILDSVSAEDNGSYYVIISNDWGTTPSDTFTVEVITNTAPDWNSDTLAIALAETDTLNYLLDTLCSDSDEDSLSFSLIDTDLITLDTTLFTKVYDYESSGTDTLRFEVSDGLLTDTLVVAVTISNTNRAPEWDTLTVIPSVNEGDTVAFTVNTLVSDADKDSVFVILDSVLLNGAVVSGEYYSEGTISFITTNSDSGRYEFFFSATDSIAESVSHTLTLTVGNVNQNPQWNDISTIPSVNEGDSVNFTVDTLVKDLDGDAVMITLDSVTFNGTIRTGEFYAEGVISFVTTTSDSGTFVFYFSAKDSIGTPVTLTLTLAVGNVNQKPVWKNVTTIPAVNEGDPVSFTVDTLVSDPDGDAVTIALDSIAFNGAIVSGNFYNNGTISFETTANDSGIYSFFFSATDSIDEAVAHTLTLVVGNVNQKPVWKNVTTIPAVNEGDPVSFTVDTLVSDPDGDAVTIALDSIAFNGAIVTGNFYNNGTISFETTANDSGIYSFFFSATDSIDEAVAHTLTLAVGNVNQKPVWKNVTTIPAVNEGDPVSFTVDTLVSDPDGDAVTIALNKVTKDGTEITGNFYAAGVLSMNTDYSSAGSYIFEFSATDSIDNAVNHSFTLVVEEKNQAPQFEDGKPLRNYQILENVTFTAPFNAVDLDGDKVTYSLTKSNFPRPATVVFDTATQTIQWVSQIGDEGAYSYTITASDGKSSTNIDVDVAVGDVNIAPAFESVKYEKNGVTALPESSTPQFTIREQDTLTIVFQVSDINTEDVISLSLLEKVEGLIFDSSAKKLIFIPTYELSTLAKDTLVSRVGVIASDGEMADTLLVSVLVNNKNQKPTAVNDSKTIDEDTPATISVLSNDTDLDALDRLVVTILNNGTVSKAGAAVSVTSNNIYYEPVQDYTGTDSLEYVITDSLGAKDTAKVFVTVTPINDAPTFTTPTEDTVTITLAEFESTTLTFSASDPDGTIPVLSMPTTTAWSLFNPADGTLKLSPDSSITSISNPDSVFTFTVIATDEVDNLKSVSKTVICTVTNVNRAPSFTGITSTLGTSETGIGNPYEKSLSFSDIDKDPITLTLEPSTLLSYDSINDRITFTSDRNEVTIGQTVNCNITISDGEKSESITWDVTVGAHVWDTVYNLSSISRLKNVLAFNTDTVFILSDDGSIDPFWQFSNYEITEYLESGNSFVKGSVLKTLDHTAGQPATIKIHGNSLYSYHGEPANLERVLGSGTDYTVNTVLDNKGLFWSVGDSIWGPTSANKSVIASSLSDLMTSMDSSIVFAQTTSNNFYSSILGSQFKIINAVFMDGYVQTFPLTNLFIGSENGEVLYSIKDNQLYKTTNGTSSSMTFSLTNAPSDIRKMGFVNGTTGWVIANDGASNLLYFSNNHFTNSYQETNLTDVTDIIIAEDREAVFVIAGGLLLRY